MLKKQLSVDELRYGMYVSELDRPWTDTPFVFQGFLLRTPTQLEALRRYCKHVFVDVERGVEPDDRRLAGEGPIPGAHEQVRGSTGYPELAGVESEFGRARDVYAESLALVEDIIRSAHTGEVLDSRRVREAVARITETIVRNPDALMLVSKLREKGPLTLTRALDVSIYMVVFGRFLQLPRDDLELLGMLGLLQDVGKVRLPSALLEKKGRLTPEETALARRHVEYSVDMLRDTPGLPPRLIELVPLHHERHDGSGYPRGLKWPDIGLYGSLAGIVDTFDALTTMRPYAEQMSPSNALGLLYKERGSNFHPALVEQFIQCIGIFPVGSVVELNTGEVGIVIAQNLVRRLKPRVMVVLDADGRPMRPHKILDLVKEPKASADEAYHIRRTLEHSKVQLDPREFFL